MIKLQGSQYFLKALNKWGIKIVFGVTGGAVFEIVKYLPEYQTNKQDLQFFTLSEYAAGFAPIGTYLNNNQISACLAVSGNACKLLACGLSDAKTLRVPALYIMALNNAEHQQLTPLQDVSIHGANMVEQITAELKEDAVYLKKISDLPACLNQLCHSLSHNRPAAFLYHPDELKKTIDLKNIPELSTDATIDKTSILNFLQFLEKNQKNIYLYICSEAGFNPQTYPLIKKFQEKINARVICTVNGSNACVGLANYYGHVGIGGQPNINQLWENLSHQDVLITLGIEAGDYHFLKHINQVSKAWIFSNQFNGYGFINESYQHRFKNECHLVKGDLVCGLNQIISLLDKHKVKPLSTEPPPELAEIAPQQVPKHLVDLSLFFKLLQKHWKYPSICFDDVCAAYRDRQFVMHQGHPNIRFYTSQDSSSMGGVFGMLIGAKLAQPNTHCFAFSGDGCWRLFAGAMPEAKDLGIILFILNNQYYGIVEESLPTIYPQLHKQYYHTKIQSVDFVLAAKACGWDAVALKPDLSNLENIMKQAYVTKKSLLIDIPCLPHQNLGFNPRTVKLS